MHGNDAGCSERVATRAWPGHLLFVCIAWAALAVPTHAQKQRSAWMWSSDSHPFGAVNVLGNVVRENELISYFGAWGFDRIYTSVGNLPLTDATTVARWNAALDDTGMGAQMLLGEPTWTTLPNRNHLLTLIWQAAFGSGTAVGVASGTAIPEPSGMWLAGCALTIGLMAIPSTRDA